MIINTRVIPSDFRPDFSFSSDNQTSVFVFKWPRNLQVDFEYAVEKMFSTSSKLNEIIGDRFNHVIIELEKKVTQILQYFYHY